MDFNILAAIVFVGALCLLFTLVVNHVVERALDTYLTNAREQRKLDEQMNNDDLLIRREQLDFDYAQKNFSIAVFATENNRVLSDAQGRIVTHGISR